MDIDRTSQSFPVKNNVNFLAYCSVSPLYRPAAERAAQCLERQLQVGRGMIFEYSGDKDIPTRFHRSFGRLLKTSPDNISMTTNTSEGMSMIANGYPFEPGDQIISYVHEYPSNHYPWRLQERRGADWSCCLMWIRPRKHVPTAGRYRSPSRGPGRFERLRSRVTDRTRVIALSHVQFTSGYAADLRRLGELCQEHHIDLVINAAQSLGCLPIYPEELGISALASAGWKWLLGPVGTGVMYTNPSFRDKIQITMGGADQMVQGADYLDHTWNPHTTGRKFEYSTLPYNLFDGIAYGVEQLLLSQTMEDVRDYNFTLQELALTKLDMDKYQPVVHRPESRSGILSLIPQFSTAQAISDTLASQGIIITPRDGYLRFAPHLCTTEDEVEQAVEALNNVSREGATRRS